MSYPNYRYRTDYSRDDGIERARQHIREAEEFTREFGGSDRDVKEYFFSLPSEQLAEIFKVYGRTYGWKAKQYAEETIGKWRSGKVQMSGMVAKRLFDLLPPRMPLSEKYRLTEKLWRHMGPSSKKVIRIGLDAQTEDVVSAVRRHVEQVVTHYTIPKQLEKRFQWLSAGDVQVKQKLLNHLREKEKELVMEGARAQLPVMLRHLRMDGSRYTSRMAQVLKIGKHEVELLIDRDINGIRLKDSISTRTTGKASVGKSYRWLWWVVAIAAILAFLIA